MSKHIRWFWCIISFGALTTLALGSYGYLLLGHTPLNALFAGLQLFVMETSFTPKVNLPLVLEIARFLAPVVMAATAIRGIMLLLGKQISTLKRSRLKNHVVICGLGRKGYQMVRQYRQDNLSVVVIEENESNSYSTACELLGAHMLIGNADSEALLKSARAQFAAKLFLMTGNDGANLAALMKVSALIDEEDPPHSGPATWLHMKAFDMCTFLRHDKALKEIKAKMQVEVISMHEVVARDLLVNHVFPLAPVKENDPRPLHLIIAGFGRLGKTLATRAVRMLVLPNQTKLKITVADFEAETETANLISEHPHLLDFCEIEALTGNIEHAVFRATLAELLDNTDEVPILVFCVDDAYINMSSALSVAESCSDEGQPLATPIFVRQAESGRWSELLQKQDDQPCGEGIGNIEEFGALAEVCQTSVITQETLDIIAKSLHEYYTREFSKSDQISSETWANLPWGFKDSNRQAADHIAIKLGSLGYCTTALEDDAPAVKWPPSNAILDKLAQLEHRRWLVERTMAGWKRGKKSIHDQSVSRDLVGWGNIDKEAKRKDRSHVVAYEGILFQAGLKIIQRPGMRPTS